VLLFYAGLSTNAILCCAHTQHIRRGSFTRASGHRVSYDGKVLEQVPDARWPLFGTCTHIPGGCLTNARLEPGSNCVWHAAAVSTHSTCLWKGEQLTAYTGPACGEKASSAGALRGTELPVWRRASVSAAVEHFRE